MPSNESRAASRPVTKGPGYHWFGYYDKLQFDPQNRRLLAMETTFEGRSPQPDDVIQVGWVDLEEGHRWTAVGRSRAWCWQQGCMLQWIPGNHPRVIWNDRSGDRFISRVLDVESGDTREIPRAVYALAPDGVTAVAADFRRINDMRPGYGYAGIPDANADDPAPRDAGIWRVDLASGSDDLIVSIADIARIAFPGGDISRAKHYFNHLLVNPDGTRFIFLHRWRFEHGHFHTRMMTASLDGADVRVVDHSGFTSHFIWRDPAHILAFTRVEPGGWAFYLFDERTGGVELVIDEKLNGHCTYLPGNTWILNDTYPLGPQRTQGLYLYHVPSGRKVPLGDYPAPPGYEGEWRCDLHPRFSRDGRTVVFDSAHEGGRQMYLLDIGAIIT